jgi:hypothetical protein
VDLCHDRTRSSSLVPTNSPLQPMNTEALLSRDEGNTFVLLLLIISSREMLFISELEFHCLTMTLLNGFCPRPLKSQYALKIQLIFTKADLKKRPTIPPWACFSRLPWRTDGVSFQKNHRFVMRLMSDFEPGEPKLQTEVLLRQCAATRSRKVLISVLKQSQLIT